MYKILFSTDKSGRPRMWSIDVKQTGLITKTHGLIDGKKTVTSTQITSGKNIGKSNETTIFEQALIQAKHLIKKQKDSGYVETMEELDTTKLILPMLANKYDTMKHYIDTSIFYVQPKLDGVRMLVGKIDGNIIMISRTGKKILHLEHIKQEVEPLLDDGDFFDGENFSTELDFEQITGMCRTSLDKSAFSKDMKLIHFHIFDYFNINRTDNTFEERLRSLIYIFEKFTFKYIHFVETKQVSDIKECHQEFVRRGFEGTIVRHPRGKYLVGERSNHLLKYKDFETAEFRITGANEAIGRDKGTVIWICELSNGETFNVRPKGTFEARKRWFDNRSKYMGKFLTVQYQNLSPGGVPRFPVGLSIRDYE